LQCRAIAEGRFANDFDGGRNPNLRQTAVLERLCFDSLQSRPDLKVEMTEAPNGEEEATVDRPKWGRQRKTRIRQRLSCDYGLEFG
jgi:hypothetical protein